MLDARDLETTTSENTEPHDHDEAEAQDHEHGGLFREKTELIFGLNIGPTVVLHEGLTLLVVGNARRLLEYGS